jgi:Ca2+-binding RTX toxin-like protein
VLVASGVTGGDGRNESIQYQPLVTGTYRVRVLSENQTTGDYFLSKNFSPVITSLTAPAAINENDTATVSGTFSDPDVNDTHTVTIHWGGGTPGQPDEGSTTLSNAALTYLGNGIWSFSASHQYLDDNPTGTSSDAYAVSVTVADNHNASNSAGTSLTVNNVAPVITSLSGPTPNPGVRGQTLTFGGSFTDVGTLDTHTATFDWGDGSSSPAVVTESGGSGTVSASHVYTGSGSYNVTLTVRDDDLGVVSQSTSIVISAAALQNDPTYPGTTALAVGGTTGDDTIVLHPIGNTGKIEVLINGVSQGTFIPTGRLIVFGQAGNDDIQVAGNIPNAAWLFGGDGNDRLKGGAGNNVLVGGNGNDILIGGSGRNLLIGGDGADQLIGNGGDDILIGGRTAFDANDAALAAVMAEWTSSRSYADRVANLRGLGTGLRINGDYFLKTSGPDATVFDDGSADILTGGAGLDWFFAGIAGTINGQHNGEQVG